MELDLVVDMYGCPNRCKHCWLGHMPNRIMEEGSDEFIVTYFDPYFDKITYYSWAREPDYCDDYRERWYRDIKLSKNSVPERFELGSFYRMVRDENYIPFLKEVGVKKVQLSFFGLKETQDYYVGRKGAYEEIMKASDLLIENGVIPRWQCFINKENKDEILELYKMAKKIRTEKCKELEFFVHEGTCDGENRKLYDIRIDWNEVPEELMEVFLDYKDVMSERQCCEILMKDESIPDLHYGDSVVLYISNTFDVFYNFTNMTKPWIIGNLKTDEPKELVRKIIEEDTYALNRIRKTSWPYLVKHYGNMESEKMFRMEDYTIYLFNEYLKEEE